LITFQKNLKTYVGQKIININKKFNNEEEWKLIHKNINKKFNNEEEWKLIHKASFKTTLNKYIEAS